MHGFYIQQPYDCCSYHLLIQLAVRLGTLEARLFLRKELHLSSQTVVLIAVPVTASGNQGRTLQYAITQSKIGGADVTKCMMMTSEAADHPSFRHTFSMSSLHSIARDMKEKLAYVAPSSSCYDGAIRLARDAPMNYKLPGGQVQSPS